MDVSADCGGVRYGEVSDVIVVGALYERFCSCARIIRRAVLVVNIYSVVAFFSILVRHSRNRAARNYERAALFHGKNAQISERPIARDCR